MAGLFTASSNQYIDLDAHQAGLETDNGTIFAYVRSDKSSGSSRRLIFSIGDSGSNGCWFSFNGPGFYAHESFGWYQRNASANRLGMYYRNGADFLHDGAWHRVAARLDGVDNALFLNGVKVSVSFGAGAANTSGAFLTAAAVSKCEIASVSYWSGTPSAWVWDGAATEIAIWDVGLSDNELIAITNGARVHSLSRNVKAYWRINEKAKTNNIVTPIDLSGNGYDGSPTNTPTYTESPVRIL